MNLPNDVARCTGQSMDGAVICLGRDTCKRYLAPRSPQVWMMTAEVPGPCGFRMDVHGALCPAHGSYTPCPWCAKGAPDFRAAQPPVSAPGANRPDPRNTQVTPVSHTLPTDTPKGRKAAP